MLVVVSYDIVNDRRRKKVSDTLLDFGARVQYSVFECDVTPVQYQVLRQRVESLVAVEEDTVRFYMLCKKCVERVEFMGQGKLQLNADFYIV